MQPLTRSIWFDPCWVKIYRPAIYVVDVKSVEMLIACFAQAMTKQISLFLFCTNDSNSNDMRKIGTGSEF